MLNVLDQLFPLGIAFAFGLLANEIVKFARRVSKDEHDEY